jgi:predicted phosphodiesterase
MAKGDELATELCRRFPDAANRTLAKRLNDEHPAIFPTIERARNAVRYCRGAIGSENRQHTKGRDTMRKPRKAGELPPLPKSIEKEWEPFTTDARRILVLSDLHIPHHSVQAIDAALAFGDDFNPDAILINGDLFDFYQISRFDKNPTLPGIASELCAGGQFFDHLRARFPKAQLLYKLGNHDERWAAYLFRAAPLLADIPEIVKGWEVPAGIQRNSVTVIGEQRPIMLGKLMVLHGHEKGRGISSPVNPARGAFLRLLCNVLEGHGHRQSEHEERTADDRLIVCRTTACLCGLWPDYAKVNKWGHGFAIVEVDRDGEYEVQLKRIRHGKCY